MEQAKEAFIKHPTEYELEIRLGESYRLWKQIEENTKALTAILHEWKIYSKKTGWTMLVKRRKRTLYYMLPNDGYFTLSFVFGDRAVNAIEHSEISEQIKDELLDARKYMEGRGIQIKVTKDEQLNDIRLLVQAKLEY